MRKRLAAVAVLALASSLAGGSAVAGRAFHPGRVVVTPATGVPITTFIVSFKAPERTGVVRGTERHELLRAAAPNGSHGCLTHVDLRAPDARKGHRVAVRLAPSRLGRHWCAGTYRGEIRETQSRACAQHRLCPTSAILRGVVGRFTFHVNSAPPGSGTGNAPVFAGLQQASACTPGPQRPGQTTPYTLIWQAATDDQTPSSQIVYDVYYATQAGGENFATPTWVTPPGMTSFRTPGLPSHGAAYFVVRARDQAGREDRNMVEKPGIDPCL